MKMVFRTLMVTVLSPVIPFNRIFPKKSKPIGEVAEVFLQNRKKPYDNKKGGLE